MAINYKVSISIPSGLFELFGQSKEFTDTLNVAVRNHCIEFQEDNIYTVEFDNLTDAEECNKQLELLFDEYNDKRNQMIAEVNQLQKNLDTFINKIPLEQLKELLSLDEVLIQMPLFGLLVSEATDRQDNV